MSTSTVKLYANARISPRNNFIVDSLSNYLATLSDTITISDFQYIKHGLNIEIKVSLDQAYLDYHDLTNRLKYNYCSIVNSDQKKTVYYFIMDMEWRGMSTIKLTLSMDTINTFRENDDFYFDDKTKINRQHKDRFVKIAASTITEDINGTATTTAYSGGYRYTYIYINSAWIGLTYVSNTITTNNANVGVASVSLNSADGTLTISFVDGSTGAAVDFSYYGTITFTKPAHYLRKIDLTSEGVTPVLYGREVEEVAPSDDNPNWYLVYRGSPIVCLAYPENPITVFSAGNDTITSLPATNTYYYLMEDRTDGESITRLILTTSNGNNYVVGFYPSVWDKDGFSYSRRQCVCMYYDGTHLYIRKQNYIYYLGGWHLNYTSDFEKCSSITILGASALAHVLTSAQTSLSTIYGGSTYEFSITGDTNLLNDISYVTRTDSDIIKIIKLPYAPLNINDFSATWVYNSSYKTLQLKALDTVLSTDLETTNNPMAEMNIDLSGIAITDARDPGYESKLYHSDYYQPKFVYDSFSFVFALERINTGDFEMLSGSIFKFTFVATNTVNSRFLYVFTQYTTDDYKLNDYDNILYVNRNNEVIVLNDSYMEYLRLGYNYDVKSRQRQETGQWIGFGLSLVGAVVSFATSGQSGPAGIAAGVALATSAMAQLTSAVNTTAQAEASQYQKIQQLTNQRNSVMGADDIDLMTYYANNKAKLMLYQCSSKMQDVLFDLFFYTGYISGVMGIPDTTSRTRFNFVSCEPVFQQSTLTNIPEDILSDIELKMNAGVTYIHYYNSEWDFDQRYENWETSLF